MSTAMEMPIEDDSLWNINEDWSFPILMSDEINSKMMVDASELPMMRKDVVSPTPMEPSALLLQSTPQMLQQQQQQQQQQLGNKGKKRGGSSSSSHGESEHDKHILTERERRKKMKNMFDDLHSLIPHLPAKTDKSTIVNGAILHIQELEKCLSELRKEKERREELKATKHRVSRITTEQVISREAFLADHGGLRGNSKSPVAIVDSDGSPSTLSFKTYISPNVVLSVCGKDALINITCRERRANVLTVVALVMDKYQLEVVTAKVSGGMYMIHAQANVEANELPKMLLFVEQLFKLAANDIMMMLNV